MSKLELYGLIASPPVRACYLTLKALDVDFEFKVVDILGGEHMSEEFLKHNPQHTVPVLNDNGNWIWDSHAICAYLVDKYGKDDSLYPKDLLRRAVVNQRLFFDVEHIFGPLRNIMFPLVTKNITVVMREKTESVQRTYEFFEKFVSDTKYLAGDQLTIADFCCGATMASLRGIIPPPDPSKYPNTAHWFLRLEALPYYEEANGKGAKAHIAFARSKISEIIY